MMLIGSYGLVVAGLMIGKPGQAMWMLTVAITLTGACPDHWRTTGTLGFLYFEAAVIVACCSGVYVAAAQLAAKQPPRVRAQDSALLASLPLGCLVHYVLVMRTRRTLTVTAPLGVLTQLFPADQLLLEEEVPLRLELALLSFHAICNINRIQASLERIGSGIALALYDAVGHFLFGSLLLALACVCLMRSKSWPLLGEDRPFLQSSLQGWVIYGSLLCIQAALVGGVYSYYTVVLRRFNPFTVREGVVFNRWWSGDALAWVSRRPAGRWRYPASNGGADTLSSSMVPLMANPAQSAVGMLAWAQPSLDTIVGYVGPWLTRLIALPISGHIQTRDKAMADWLIKGFAHQDEISRVGNVLRDVILLLNAETDDVNMPLLEAGSGKVSTVGEFATYVLICCVKRASWLLPMACALVRALERHNHGEYTEAFKDEILNSLENTRKTFRLFGKDGMLSRVMLYSVCVAGVSATWDATDEEDFLHIATAQCAVVILQLHSKFASIHGLLGKLEDDMVTVFRHDQGMRDDTISTASFHL